MEMELIKTIQKQIPPQRGGITNQCDELLQNQAGTLHRWTTTPYIRISCT